MGNCISASIEQPLPVPAPAALSIFVPTESLSPSPQAPPVADSDPVPAAETLEPLIPYDTTIRSLSDGNRYTLKMTHKGLRTLRANNLTWSKNGVRTEMPMWPTLNEFLKSLPDGTEISFDFRLRRINEGDMWEACVENFRKVVAYYGLTVVHEYVFSESAGGSYICTTPLRMP